MIEVAEYVEGFENQPDVDAVASFALSVQPPPTAIARAHLRERLVPILKGKGFEAPAKFVDTWYAQWPIVHDEEMPEAPIVEDTPALAKNTDILGRFAEDIETAGLVGERRNAQLLFLAALTRVRPRIVSVVGKGESSVGKSEVMKRVLAFVPPEGYIDMTAMSERFLIYTKESFAHRIIVLYEAAATEDDSFQGYVVRSLLSENRIKYGTIVKGGPEGLVGKTVDKPGPTGLFLTTTQVRLYAENETRLLSISGDDTPEQTKAIMEQIASLNGNAVDVEPWFELQRWIAQRPRDVVIPFARELARLMPSRHVRLRRDFKAVLSLIEAHALLHQFHREGDDEKIVADIDDYNVVRDVVGEVLGETLKITVSDSTRQTVEAVATLASRYQTGVPNKAVAKHLDVVESTATRRLRVAAEGGYVENREDRPGRQSRWVIADPLPDDQIPLPKLLSGGDGGS